MKAVNSRIIHQLSFHLLPKNLRSRNFFRHSNTLSLRREERYKLAIHKFLHSIKLSTILCQRLIQQTSYQLELTNSLRLISQQWKYKCIEQSALSNLSRQLRRILRTWQLSCVQAACLILHPINAKNDLSTIGWRQFLDLKSSNLINPNAQAFNYEGSKGELYNIVYSWHPMYARTLTPFSNQSLIFYQPS